MFQNKGKEPAAFSINHNIISSCPEVLGALPQTNSLFLTLKIETCSGGRPSEPHWIFSSKPALQADA